MRPLQTVTPALTCSVQATFMTGLLPDRHGAVGNGWLFSGSNGSAALAAIELIDRRRESLGSRQEARCRLYLRQPLLVVQHGRQPRPRSDAAADLQGRWAQARGLLLGARGPAGRVHGKAGPVSLIRVSGGQERLLPRADGSQRPLSTSFGPARQRSPWFTFPTSTTTCNAMAPRGPISPRRLQRSIR
jgi:hypothetical protein